MKLKIILFCFFCFAIKPILYSQNTDSLKSNNIFVKIIISQLITGEALISCEKIKNERNSFEVGLGIIYPFKPWISFIASRTQYDELEKQILSNYYCYGIDFKAQYKFFFNTFSSFYISPLFMFKYVFKNNADVYYPFNYEKDHAEYHSNETDKTNICGIELLLGRENNKPKKSILTDFYYGVGIRIRSLYNGPFHILKIYNKNSYAMGSQESSDDFGRVYLIPTLHIGLKIGYNKLK